jgi:hypothetical protein
VEATLSCAEAWRRVHIWTFTMSKSAAPTGAVVIGVWAHETKACAHAHTLSGHELDLNGLRLVLRAICPPALAAEGRPCAGYSGFSLEPCSEIFIELEKPQ